MTQVATNYVREFQSVEVDVTNKAGENKIIVGGWTPVNPTDPHVIEIAKFAVNEYNKQAHTKLVFIAVIKGWQQLVNGMNYRLFIEAKDEKPVPPIFPPPKLYEAFVYEDFHGNKKLKSFGPLPQGAN